MSETRTQLNIKIDPKTHWMAKLTARLNGVSLEEFVESALVKSIPRNPRLEDMWSEDEATRFCYVAMAKMPKLLSKSEEQIWKFYKAHMKVTDGKPSIQSFRAFWQQLKGTE